MRHGQTVFNLKGKIQGASDSPLVNCRVVVGWIEYELHQSLVCLVP
ncbi:hypothetical protein ACWEH1_29035 [Micromonospora chersina]